jgi:hypothetical protein
LIRLLLTLCLVIALLYWFCGDQIARAIERDIGRGAP